MNNQLLKDLQPLFEWLLLIGGLIAVLVIMIAGVQYMTSRGNPVYVDKAKRTLKNACLGLILILSAGFLTSFFNGLYRASPTESDFQPLPAIQTQTEVEADDDLVSQITNISARIANNLSTNIAQPLVEFLQYFSTQTPLVSQNPTASKLWLTVAGIANVLMVLVVILIGFGLMSSTSLGFGSEQDLKQLLPKLALIFLIINTSLPLIDLVIELSNSLIIALMATVDVNSLWSSYYQLAHNSAQANLVNILLNLAFVIIGLMLLIYYVMRLVIIYLGAILSPLVILLSAFKFNKALVISTIRTYLLTIFILFIHVLILILASSLISSISSTQSSGLNFISLVIGIASFILMLKLPKALGKHSTASSNLHTVKQLGSHAISGIQDSWYQYRASKFNQ